MKKRQQSPLKTILFCIINCQQLIQLFKTELFIYFLAFFFFFFKYSFVVIRLSFLLENTYLLLFAQALEEAVCNTMANVILYRKQENPCKIVVLLSASKDLTCELQKLHEEGFFGPPEPTQQFPLKEGDQIHFRFSGNIFASGKVINSCICMSIINHLRYSEILNTLVDCGQSQHMQLFQCFISCKQQAHGTTWENK